MNHEITRVGTEDAIMAMAEVLREKRKALGLTQEQVLTAALGHSAALAELAA